MSQDKQRRLAVEGPPPYTSYRQWKNLLDSLATFIPSRFDSSYFESIGISVTCRSMLRITLRFLGLMSPDGIPTEKLKQLVESDAGARPKVLELLIRRAYAPLFASLDMAHASRRQVDEYLKSQGITGDIARKCWSFFAALSADAGIELSPQLDRAESRKMAKQMHRREKTSVRSKRERVPHAASSDNEGLALTRMLVDKFPDFDPQWPVELKSKWFDDLRQLSFTMGPARKNRIPRSKSA